MIETPKYSEIELLYFVIEIKAEIKLMYKNLSLKTNNQDIKNMLNYLSSEQDIKTILIKKMLNKLEQDNPSKLYPEEYFSYLLEMSPKLLEKYNKNDINERSSYSEIIDFVINIHNAVYVYFYKIKKDIISADNKVINDILDEEQKQINKINSMKDNTIKN